MRILGATIGALLISVSHIALAQEHHGEQPNDTLRAEHQCEPSACLPEISRHPDEHRQDDAEPRLTESSEPPAPAGMQPEVTAEQVLAQLPEAPLAEAADARQPAAEQILAHLPERPPAAPADMQPPTAEEILAQLPESRPAEAAETPPQPTAEQILRELPEPRLAAKAETQPQPRAEQILRELPEPRPAATAEMQARPLMAAQILAELPERRLVDPRDELLAQLPARRLPEPQATTAEQVLAALPDRPLPEAQPAEAEEMRVPEAMKADMQQAPLVEMEMPRDPKWTALAEPNLGTTLDLPRAMFAVADGHAHKGVGRRYRTADGRAKVAVWTQRANSRHETPAGYLRRTFKIPRATVDYERFTPEFGAVSGVYSGKVYYLRCNLSSRDGTFHCFDLTYPARHKKAWDAVVTRMSQSLRPLHY